MDPTNSQHLEEVTSDSVSQLVTQSVQTASVASQSAAKVATDVTLKICDMIEACQSPSELKALIETLRLTKDGR